MKTTIAFASLAALSAVLMSGMASVGNATSIQVGKITQSSNTVLVAQNRGGGGGARPSFGGNVGGPVAAGRSMARPGGFGGNPNRAANIGPGPRTAAIGRGNGRGAFRGDRGPRNWVADGGRRNGDWGHKHRHHNRFIVGVPYWDNYYDDAYYDSYYNDGGDYVEDGDNGVARCRATFRSFDPSSGTYVGYDGQRRLCPYLG